MSMPPRSERPSMESYGVTDDPEGLLPWSWAEERLLGCRNFWFVTVRPDGRPHSMPVWGVWMPAQQRWGLGCARSSQKVRNLEANPNVVVTVEDTVEAISIEGARTFTIGVQWHAEFEPEKDPVGTVLFREFGKAAHARQMRRAKAAAA